MIDMTPVQMRKQTPKLTKNKEETNEKTCLFPIVLVLKASIIIFTTKRYNNTMNKRQKQTCGLILNEVKQRSSNQMSSVKRSSNLMSNKKAESNPTSQCCPNLHSYLQHRSIWHCHDNSFSYIYIYIVFSLLPKIQQLLKETPKPTNHPPLL